MRIKKRHGYFIDIVNLRDDSGYKIKYHPRNIPAKFGSNWPSGFGEEA
jgi:hypothetical protein